ncbi:phytanoyl-CoA dioxygenase [Paraburkholderia hospita]|uniref:Phytanoyl-CoA dioxygenase n=1 Tax=Paraburkholderia hospita TaxID=169430 RepID=A0ABP2PYA3_9BURK|nr:phytanoyl-CoA dioxygenase family protein [Paraburkholderia hospita]EIN02798.1 phytanoyl-CoA dioxygenase [Paraburkholderia hospita]OUL80556.1 phytanoyl-CoA dioxygenase [Paraburkholderia hospita]OUL89659.1 phytanoyl-CoA dioxygenase [Paraburkholderia hospita]
MTKHLTEAQIAHFKQHGYVYPMRAISAQEAAEYRRVIEQYEASSGEDVNKTLKIKGHLALPAIVELARRPAILDAVEDLIGPDIMLFGASIFAKNGRDPRYVSWHQDSTYFGLTPHEEVTVWVALTPANSVNGVLRVLPGSHSGPGLKHVETYAKDNMLAKGQTLVGIDEALAVEMPLQPGEFSMHHERTAHSSLPNRSDDRRIGFAFFYVPAHVRSASGRRRATLVRGVDRFDHWDPDTLPEYDCDPRSMSELAQTWGKYKDGEVKQAADMIAPQ